MPDGAASTTRTETAETRLVRKLALGADALLTAGEAASLIRKDDREVRGWIEANVRARWVAGARFYRWGDILDASAEEQAKTAGPATRGLHAVCETIGRREVKPR